MRYLTPPSLAAEDDDRLARVIHWNALGFTVLMVAYLIATALGPTRPIQLYAAFVLMIAVGVTTLALVRVTRPRIGGAFFCLAMWVLIQGGIYSSGGIHSTGVIALLLLVLTAGFFWSGAAAAAFALVSSMSTLPLAVGWVEPIAHEPTAMQAWGTLALALGMTWVVLIGPLTSLRRSVASARANAREAERLLLEQERIVASERALRQKLERVRRLEAVGRLAGGVAHDYNNYLMVIMTNLALLENRAPAGELADIAEAADRASKLTERLLAFARRQPAAPTRLDVAAVLRSMEGLLRQLCRDRVVLEIDGAGDVAPVLVDESELEQVLVNLVANARDAMPDGGTVHLRCGLVTIDADADEPPRGRCVSLTVRDTGTGMTPEVMQNVFEPFFSTKGERGTGLGLATVHRIVTESEGRITVESAPGAGTTVTILWPAADRG